jgi:uncharacterized membrane protein YheB (UPF0754 family)
MNENWFFLFFPAIGALIGAVTNHLAIKMLFRPYKPIFLGKWRLPLTPGVIPMQRETIAKNIAETFETNLLSGNDIHQILTGEKARQAVADKVDSLFAQFGPLANMFASAKPMIVGKIIVAIEEMSTEAVSSGGSLNIGQKIESRINAMPVEKLEDLVLGFSKQQFRYITWFGGLLGALIGLIQAALTLVL